MKHLANVLTGSRVLLAILLLFIEPFSGAFFVAYCMGGLTDMFDGMIARATGNESRFGEKLDSIADLLFVGVCLYLIVPSVCLPLWLYLGTGCVIALRFYGLLWSRLHLGRFIMLHTLANKCIGCLLFAAPFFLGQISLYVIGTICLAVSLFAAVDELIRLKKMYR